MKLLLDTHVWVWTLLKPESLSKKVRNQLQDSDNEVWISPVSAWELVMLNNKRRLTLLPTVAKWVRKAMEVAPIQEALMTTEVALETRRVRLPHRDPADYLIAATARVFDLTLVTADRQLLGARGVPTMKAD